MGVHASLPLKFRFDNRLKRYFGEILILITGLEARQCCEGCATACTWPFFGRGLPHRRWDAWTDRSMERISAISLEVTGTAI